MTLWEALLFGIVEGVTEFLPISSTGHLTILEKLLGYPIAAPDVTAFTAIIQSGAVIATLIYFRKDIAGMLRNTRYGLTIALGSIPIIIAALLFKDQIETVLRSLWVVAGALIIWSGVLWYADRHASQKRHEGDVTWRDSLIIGIAQCLALIPGVSRSGATMSAGLLRGLDRVTATKLSFFLSIPALLAAGAYQLVTEYEHIGPGVGWPATIFATFVSFITAYFVIAWLLKYVARHDLTIFIRYRLALGVLLIILLVSGVVPAS